MNSVLIRINNKNYYISYDDFLNKTNNDVKLYNDRKLTNSIGNFDKSEIEKYIKNSIKMPSLMPSALKTENNQEKKMSSEQKIRKYIREQIIEILSEQDGETPSAEELEAKKKSAEDKARKQAYARFFSKALAKFGYSSLNSLPDEKKKEFFDFIDSNWTSKQEQSKKKVDENRPENTNLEETSFTGGVSGYETPNAFAGKQGISKKQRQISQQLGYELVDKSYATKEGIQEATNAFYFKDENLTSEQKLGLAVRQIRNNLQEVEELVKKSIKFKNENDVSIDGMGKRTYSALKRINEKTVKLMILLNGMK